MSGLAGEAETPACDAFFCFLSKLSISVGGRALSISGFQAEVGLHLSGQARLCMRATASGRSPSSSSLRSSGAADGPRSPDKRDSRSGLDMTAALLHRWAPGLILLAACGAASQLHPWTPSSSSPPATPRVGERGEAVGGEDELCTISRIHLYGDGAGGSNGSASAVLGRMEHPAIFVLEQGRNHAFRQATTFHALAHEHSHLPVRS